MSRSKKLNSSPPLKSRVIQVCLFLVRLFLLGAVHIEDDVLFDSVLEQITGLVLRRLHRRPNLIDEG
jgi:hypothetical protein